MLALFKKKHRYSAVVKSFKGKLRRAKQSPDAAMLRCIVVDLDVPITADIKRKIGEDLAKLLDADGTVWNSVDVSEKATVVAQIFGANNFSPDSKPVLSAGADNGDDAIIRLKKVFAKSGDEAPRLRLELDMKYTAERWQWGGELFGDGQVVLETTPFQSEFDFDKKAGEDSKDVAEAKKKGKKAAAA